MAETDASGTNKCLYVYGSYIDEVLYMKAGGNEYYYVHDHLYSPAALTDTSGVVIERYEYDAYGNCYVLEPNFADDPGKSDYNNPYFFQGRRLDLLDDGGLELMSWPYRNYSTYLGRWLQAEKLGMIPNDNEQTNAFGVPTQYKHGLSLHQAFSSNPVLRADVLGLEAVCCKIEEEVTRSVCEDPFYGPCVDVASTTCRQQTIHGDCSDPHLACCARYANRSRVRVYDWHAGECCWCDARLNILITRGMPIIPHFWVIVTCDEGGPRFGAESNPLSGGDITFSVGDDLSFFGRTIHKCRISCEQAEMWKMVLETTSWDYSLFGNNCWQFASALYIEMCGGCP